MMSLIFCRRAQRLLVFLMKFATKLVMRPKPGFQFSRSVSGWRKKNLHLKTKNSRCIWRVVLLTIAMMVAFGSYDARADYPYTFYQPDSRPDRDSAGKIYQGHVCSINNSSDPNTEGLMRYSESNRI